MLKNQEGSLEAPTRHPLQWQEDSFYNKKELYNELERIFDACHGCRRCVSLCQAFPTLFDLIDESKTMEIDSVNKQDYYKVVDQCYLCDLCYMTKCPYVPPHEWNIDFPHLMLRAKAVKFKDNKTPISHKLLSSPQQIGNVISFLKISFIVNYFNNIKFFRKILSNVMDVHSKALIPKYYSNKTYKKLLKIEPQNSDYKVAIFTTCYAKYNDPEIVVDLADVLKHNKVEVKIIAKTQCCGMPKLELGDIKSAVKYANQNKKILLDLINQGYKIIAPIPSCVLMFKNELPMILNDDKEIQNIAKAFYDPFEYLAFLNKEGVLNTNFKDKNINVLYHVACHQRVQNIGAKTKQILTLIPNISIKLANRCSGHDGTYGVKNNSYEFAVKIAKPIVKQINDKTDYIISDCVMAGKHIANLSNEKKIAKHPITLMKLLYKDLGEKNVK